MRSWVKRAAARWAGRIVAPPVGWSLRLTRRRAGVALLYHGIEGRQGDPRKDLSPPIAERVFARQLDHLRRHYKVVAPESFPGAVASRRRGDRFPVCLTFDDDLNAHVEFAMPMLKGRDLPATFFLCGATLEGAASPWWERLQRAVDGGRAPEDLVSLLPDGARANSLGTMDIHDLGRKVESLTPDQRKDFSEQLLDLAGPDPRDSGLREQGVAELAAAGFGIGFHTRHHDTLTSLTDNDLKRSMVEGRQELSDAAGAPLRAIAYPHGRGDRRVASAARQAGFEIGFTGARRLTATHASDPLLLGRCDTVSLGPSPGEFAIGIAWTLLRNRSEELADE